MKVSQLIFIIAVIILSVWFLGLILRVTAWLLGGLVYVAAIVVIAGLIYSFIENKKRQK